MDTKRKRKFLYFHFVVTFFSPASDFLLTLLFLIFSNLLRLWIASQADALCSLLTCCFIWLCNTCTFLVISVCTHGPNLSLVYCQGVTLSVNMTLSIFLTASEFKFPNIDEDWFPMMK